LLEGEFLEANSNGMPIIMDTFCQEKEPKSFYTFSQKRHSSIKKTYL